MITEFVFVRHGETEANRIGILQGCLNYSLNHNGIMQAEAVAEYLRHECFDAVYSSDLLRAAETAEKIVAAGHENIELILSEELREWNCGKLDGLPWEDIQKQYPNEAKVFSREQIDICMPDGESGVEFQQRIESFLNQLVKKHSGRKILLIAHGGVLQRIFRMVGGVPGEKNMIPLAGNASVSSFIYLNDSDMWQLTSWNRNDHLKNIPQHQTRVL